MNVAAPRRTPNPKPLLAVLMTVAFFGGSCTVQKMLGPADKPLSDQEVASYLGEAAQNPKTGPELIAQTQTLLTEQKRVAARFHPYALGFGLVLVTLYSFSFVFGLRAWSFGYGSARPLSRVAVLVLPARAAVAAVDFASAKALEPATKTMVLAITETQRSALPPEQAEATARMMSQAAPWVTVSLEIGSAVLVCILFHLAWRYFQRPDVVAYFDRMAGPPPDEEE